MARKRSADADPEYERRRRRRYPRYGGWVAPLQGAQFLGITAAIGEGAAGDTSVSGGDSGGGDGGGGGV